MREPTVAHKATALLRAGPPAEMGPKSAYGGDPDVVDNEPRSGKAPRAAQAGRRPSDPQRHRRPHRRVLPPRSHRHPQRLPDRRRLALRPSGRRDSRCRASRHRPRSKNSDRPTRQGWQEPRCRSRCGDGRHPRPLAPRSTKEDPEPRSRTAVLPLHGSTIDASYIRHLLPRLARRAGITKRIHAHALRHRFAIDLVEEGAPITTVRDLLGHCAVAVTDGYLRRIGAGNAVNYARRRPGQRPNSHASTAAGTNAAHASRIYFK